MIKTFVSVYYVPGIILRVLHIIHSILTVTLWGGCYHYAHSTDEKIKAENN